MQLNSSDFNRVLTGRRTIALLVADMLVIFGVLFLDWNPVRMIGFYFLDTALCITSFVIYNFIIRNINDFISAVSALLIMFVFIYFSFIGILQISYQLDLGDYRETAIQLLSPYYDLALFLSCSVIVHINNVGKYLQYKKSIAQPGFALYVGWLLILVPGLIIFVSVFNYFNLSMKIALILSLVLVRRLTETRRKKGLMAIEKETSQFQERRLQ